MDFAFSVRSFNSIRAFFFLSVCFFRFPSGESCRVCWTGFYFIFLIQREMRNVHAMYVCGLWVYIDVDDVVPRRKRIQTRQTETDVQTGQSTSTRDPSCDEPFFFLFCPLVSVTISWLSFTQEIAQPSPFILIIHWDRKNPQLTFTRDVELLNCCEGYRPTVERDGWLWTKCC